jgi:hypothetical protein
MNDPKQEAKRRTAAYWYIDGLAEIGAGCMVLLIGLFNFSVGTWVALPVRGLVVGLGQPLLIIAGFVAVRKAVISLKERITYVRTGFVAYPRPRGARRWASYLTALLGTAVAVAIVIALMPTLGEDWVMTGTGFFTGLLLAMIGMRTSLPRFYVLAGLVFLAGLAASLLHLQDPLNIALFLGVFGAAWVLMGALTLRKYLRSTHPTQAGEA